MVSDRELEDLEVLSRSSTITVRTFTSYLFTAI